MAVIIDLFAKRNPHARASTGSRTREARSVKISAVKPASRAHSVAKTADHHSEGMLSRRRHFETCEREAPISDIAASIVGQRSMIALKESGLNIESEIGQFGLFGKANVARDRGPASGQNPAMARRRIESEEKAAFIRRVKAARAARFSQEEMCTILGIDQGTYKHYEGRSPLPHRFIPKFVASTGVGYEWLLAGVGAGPILMERPTETGKKRGRRQTRSKVA